MLAEIIFCTATEYPRKTGDTTYVTSVGGKIGGAGAEEDKWPQSAFTILEVQQKVSQILICVEAENPPVGAPAYGLGHGVGLVVVPRKFDAGVPTN
jgi:hypothetical protein